MMYLCGSRSFGDVGSGVFYGPGDGEHDGAVGDRFEFVSHRLIEREHAPDRHVEDAAGGMCADVPDERLNGDPAGGLVFRNASALADRHQDHPETRVLRECLRRLCRTGRRPFSLELCEFRRKVEFEEGAFKRRRMWSHAWFFLLTLHRQGGPPRIDWPRRQRPNRAVLG